MGQLKKQSIFNESDVEQKLIYKLLSDPTPSGLGYLNEDILTKPDIRALTIDKGKSRKRYHPDYAIISNGLPSLIIEAKTPAENLESAECEARLYATELNAQFPSKLNPCNWYIVSNGEEVKLFEWDSDQPLLELSYSEINVLSPKLEKLVSIVSKPQIAKYTKKIKNKISGNPTFIKPVHLLGGKSSIKQSVGENAFGANVSLEYKYLFKVTVKS
jgi:type I site-specific restriction endonuclease